MFEQVKAYCHLLRWSNLIMLLIVVWVMEQWVAVPVLNVCQFGVQLPWWCVMLIMLSIACIAAGGYVINDYFDIKIDRINKPDQLIITQSVTKDAAMHCHQLLTILGAAMGLVVAWWCRSWAIGLTMILVPGLLWFYSSSYKRQFIIGNVIVAFLTSLPSLVVAMANVGYLQRRYGDILAYSSVSHDLYVWLGGFALFAFLTTLMREIMKDMQDQQGDRELECHTLPVRFGDWAAKWVVSIVGCITLGLLAWIGFGMVPYEHTWNTLSSRYIVFGIMTPLVCSLWLDG